MHRGVARTKSWHQELVLRFLHPSIRKRIPPISARNTYTVTRKYLRALRKLPSLSRMAVGSSSPWNLYGGWRRTVPTVRCLEGRGNPLPPQAFSIVNFPFFVSSYPGRYSCRLTAARLHKEILLSPVFHPQCLILGNGISREILFLFFSFLSPFSAPPFVSRGFISRSSPDRASTRRGDSC